MIRKASDTHERMNPNNKKAPAAEVRREKPIWTGTGIDGQNATDILTNIDEIDSEIMAKRRQMAELKDDIRIMTGSKARHHAVLIELLLKSAPQYLKVDISKLRRDIRNT